MTPDRNETNLFVIIDQYMKQLQLFFLNQEFIMWCLTIVAYRVHYKVLSIQTQVKVELLTTNLNN